MGKAAWIVVPAVIVLVAALLYSQYRPQPLKVSGVVEADEVRVGSRVGGRVRSVEVVEGDPVKTGAVLVELEPFDLREQQAQAAANLAASEAAYQKMVEGFRAEEVAQAQARRDQLAAQLAELQAGPRKEEIAAAAAQLDLADAQLNLAQLTFNRVKGAFERNAASQDEMDRATSELNVARARVAAQREVLGELQAGTRAERIAQAKAQLAEAEQAWQLYVNGYRSEEIAQAKATVEAAQAALDIISRRLEELIVRAPIDGVVEAVDLQPGDLVSANAPAISLLDMDDLWIRAYVPEDVPVQVGQEVRVTVDAYPDRDLAGRVSFVARQAEFTPSNVQTVEERSKQVFRVKVSVVEGLDVLRPGMIADVWLGAGSK
jgi:multidrug resistance efflux pump